VLKRLCTLQNVNYFNKIKGIIVQLACYFLFSTVLNYIFYIKDVYIWSTKPKNSWIYEKWPCSEVYSHYLDDSQPFLMFCDACSWVHCLSWAVKLPNDPFQQWMYGFEIHFFHPEDNWGTHTQLLQKVKTFWILKIKVNCTYNLSSGKHLSIFCCFWRAVLN